MLGNHLLGIYEKAFSPELTWPQRLAMAEELGFDYVEISIDETDQRLERLYWDEEQLGEFHRALTDSRVRIQSMCLSAHRRFPFGSADGAIRDKAYDIMERAIRFAHRFGIRVIQLAGYDVYYEQSTDQSKRLFVEGMQYAAQYAAKYQVMLAMEIMDTDFMNSITKYKALKRLVPSPWFTVYPDMGNLTAWGNDVDAELRLGKDDIVAVHIKETLRVTGDFPGKFKCVPFGTGCVDFPGAFRTLEQIGYTGPYMMEMWYQKEQDQRKEIQNALDFVREQYAAAGRG